MLTQMISRCLSVSAGYALCGFLLYRGRVLSEGNLLGSDLVVFFGPAGLAFLANTYIFWLGLRTRWRQSSAVLTSLLLGLLATLLAGYAYMLLAFNYYGT